MTLAYNNSAVASADNAWDETDHGSDLASTIDDLIETDAKATRERMNVEHIAYADETGHDDLWRHRKEAGRMNFGLAANKPANVTAGRVDGALYYETDTGLVKYWNATGEAWVTVSSPKHSGVTTTYTTGTVTVTNASTGLTGSSTVWGSNVTASDVFKGPDGEYYGIASVNSDTSITLSRVYAGSTAAGQSYTIYLDGHPQYLPKSGGTINGTLAVNGVTTLTGGATLGAALAAGANKITGLAAATVNGDAVRYEQLIGVGIRMATGTYTGNGTDDRQITGVGFQPKLVMLWEHSSATPLFAADVDAGYTKGKESYYTGRVKSMDADGFTLGTSGDANQSGRSYTYVAIGLL